MIRRILLVGGIGLGLVLGGRYALGVLAERAFEARRTSLRAVALRPAAARRPWEARFEGLSERLRTSPRFGELVASAHRPYVAWGGEEPRPLDELETLWVEAAWSELGGLESTLLALRAQAPRELEWNGETIKLHVLRECVNALCARAWLAVERGEDVAAARVYADTLRLCMATDDGTTMGLMIRSSCARTALASARSALALGLSARALRTELDPLLREWDFSPQLAERRIRRDLTLLDEYGPEADRPWYADAREHGDELAWIAPVEEGLAIARLPASASPWAAAPQARTTEPSSLEAWTLATRQLHALEAQGGVARCALAVAAFREERGAWPETLAQLTELGAEERRDALSGDTLAYTADEHAAIIGPASWGTRVESSADPERALFRWTLRASYFP